MEYAKKTKPKANVCFKQVPGPQYMLKTLTGFDDHDPSHRRSPAFTMKFRYKTKTPCTGPGPYGITTHLTNHGLNKPPAYTMKFKPHVQYATIVPGPGAYAPEKHEPFNHHPRAAAYTFRYKPRQNYNKDGPGPIYMLPSCIGPDIPNIRAEGAYSMAFKRTIRQPSVGPGPAAYDIKLNTIKRKNPAYSLKFRHEQYDVKRQIPGPQYSYRLETVKRRQPQYSFGVKYSECTTVGLTENDI